MLVKSQQNVKGSKSKYWYNNETMFERQDKLKPLIEDEYNVTYTLFRKKKRIFFFEQHLKIIQGKKV